MFEFDGGLHWAHSQKKVIINFASVCLECKIYFASVRLGVQNLFCFGATWSAKFILLLCY
ncbi:MAG: hypothetical protein DRR16_13805 [Candidatus Parabeggiatoa sp. nov. 3]|nr:MAG: hypothetical protein DRQ99_08925 [Gammaproteobacteria bacterium]RKZ84764.1 MAG: hypothetical protein DRR16_13805 [Gammaproteobacteria bacterium]